MKRRDFLKSILATPAVVGIVKAKNDLDVLKVPSFSPKPSEVKASEEYDEEVSDSCSCSVSDSASCTCSISASPSASCDDVPWIDDIDSKYL